MRNHIRRPALLGVAALALGAGLALVAAVPAFAATEDLAPTIDIASAGNAGVVETPAGLIYVADAPADLLDIYASNGGYVGDIFGAGTDLSGPTGLATDAAGDIFVANQDNNSITVYSASERNDASPTRQIVGLETMLDGVRGVAVDSSGNVYATNYASNQVTVYAPGATGDAPPEATIGGGASALDGPYGIAVDQSTGVPYVSNLLGNTVSEYAAPLASPTSPLRVIAGLASPLGVGVDAAGNVYSANYSADSVEEFDPGADGLASATTTIEGGATQLNQPAGLYVDPAGDVFVTSAGSLAEDEFAPAPTIASVSPASGPVTGGTTVTVTGAAFGPTTELEVDGVPTSPSTQTATTLTFVTAAHAVGSVDVLVTTVGGSATATHGFSYDPVLAATGLDPAGSLETGLLLLLFGVLLVGVVAGIRGARKRKPDAASAP